MEHIFSFRLDSKTYEEIYAMLKAEREEGAGHPGRRLRRCGV